jgi:hypothetical protein
MYTIYTILQIIISVVVIYVIFSCVVYIIVEWIAGVLQMRGKLLRHAVLNLFRDERIGRLIYDHPHVESLKPSNGRLPSYISSASVASALIDAIGSRVDENPESRMKKPFENFVEGIKNLERSPHRDLLITLAQQATDVKELAASIEKWFNDAMDRVSGWYKKRMRLIIIIVSAIVTVGFNVDTIHIILAAKADPALRQRLNDLGSTLLSDSTVNNVVSEARLDPDYHQDYVNDDSITEADSLELVAEREAAEAHGDSSMFKSNKAKIDQLISMNQLIADSDLPVGWGFKKNTPWLYIIIGWIITITALTAGAPFWFDVLKKLVNIRTSGIRPSITKT